MRGGIDDRLIVTLPLRSEIASRRARRAPSVADLARRAAKTCGKHGRLSPRQAQYRFRQVVAGAGIERAVTVHSLRHTFATRLRERTGDLRLLQAALGHRQIGTTEIYAIVGGRDLRRAVAAM